MRKREYIQTETTPTIETTNDLESIRQAMWLRGNNTVKGLNTLEFKMQPVLGAENFTTEIVAYEATNAITAGRKGTKQGIARAKQGQKDERTTT